ncbi:hypothetical protein [Novipirellula caenicola]|uniref:Uncharacterized protein n=1 Tax=Novipirellula caenicola TaxID=1536901 RepID=A0ABP9VJF0_9BACT
MAALSLDQNQSSILVSTRLPIEVCDETGYVLGRIVPYDHSPPSIVDLDAAMAASNGKAAPPPAMPTGRFPEDHWVRCWDEWYQANDEDEDDEEMPQTD